MGVASDGKPGLETREAIRNQFFSGAERAPVNAETLASPHASEKMPSSFLQARVVDSGRTKTIILPVDDAPSIMQARQSSK
jgi:hypothetical protein